MAKAISRAVLPTPAKTILSGRRAGGERAAKLALRDHVEPGALLDEGADHRLVRVRLHRVADQRVEAGEGLAEDAVVADERRGRIAIEGRADRGRDCGQRHVLGVEHAVAIGEVIHARLRRTERVENEVAGSVSPAFGSVGRAGARSVVAGHRRGVGGGSSAPARPQPESANAAIDNAGERGANDDIERSTEPHGATPSNDAARPACPS